MKYRFFGDKFVKSRVFRKREKNNPYVCDIFRRLLHPPHKPSGQKKTSKKTSGNVSIMYTKNEKVKKS